MKSNIKEAQKTSAAFGPDDELWTADEACVFFGGGTSKPVHISTLYRGIGTGIYPAPVNVSPGTVRWIPDECRAARAHLIAQRGKSPKPKAKSPGRPRKRIAT